MTEGLARALARTQQTTHSSPLFSLCVVSYFPIEGFVVKARAALSLRTANTIDLRGGSLPLAGFLSLTRRLTAPDRLERQMTANRITKNVKIDTAVVGCLPLLDPAKDSYQLRTSFLFEIWATSNNFICFRARFALLGIFRHVCLPSFMIKSSLF